MVALLQGDLYQMISDYLLQFAAHYPGIDDWFQKAWLESRQGRRRIWTLAASDQLLGLAIIKFGERPKLCHFSLSPSLREKGLGLRLMAIAAGDVIARGARSLHVTANDEVAVQYGGFFERCGFRCVAYAKNRYRAGSDELVWRAAADDLKNHVLASILPEPHLLGVIDPLVAHGVGLRFAFDQDVEIRSVFTAPTCVHSHRRNLCNLLMRQFRVCSRTSRSSDRLSSGTYLIRISELGGSVAPGQGKSAFVYLDVGSEAHEVFVSSSGAMCLALKCSLHPPFQRASLSEPISFDTHPSQGCDAISVGH